MCIVHWISVKVHELETHELEERKRLAQSRKDYKNSLEARILAGEKFGYFYPNGDKVPPPVWPWEEKVLSPENPWFGLIFDFLVEQAPLAPQNRIADWGDESGFVVFNKDGFVDLFV